MSKLLPCALLVLLFPCVAAADNPAAPGFDVDGSDDRAVEIADATMAAMGGRAAWDATRFVTWSFFGRRFHVWDRHRNLARVEWTDRDSGQEIVVVVDTATREGRAWVAGEEASEPSRSADLVRSGYEAWINDSYWVFMPYKLKDTGVTLTYAGHGETADGRPAEIVQLTFEGVGVTPQNKYRVYVADESGLVEQWDFYADAGDAEPRFQTPWRGWTRYGQILLADDRGNGRHTDLAVLDAVPDGVFSSPAPTGLRNP